MQCGGPGRQMTAGAMSFWRERWVTVRSRLRLFGRGCARPLAPLLLRLVSVGCPDWRLRDDYLYEQNTTARQIAHAPDMLCQRARIGGYLEQPWQVGLGDDQVRW